MRTYIADMFPTSSPTASENIAPARGPVARRYLMCAPEYFTVEYSINPWMHPDQSVDTKLALTQWNELKDIYQQLGHKVDLIEPQQGLPDMVFAANSGLVLDDTVLGARFLSEHRQPEAEHYRRWFLAHGYSTVTMPTHVNEGEGDFIWTGTVLLAGTGFRTEPQAHAEAREALGVPVISLQLVDPRYYHLDTALFVLDNRPGYTEICYYPAAFSPGSQRALARLFPDAVLADDSDAVCLGLNGVSDGYNVVLPAEATGLAEQLRNRGYNPVHVDISELRKAGGGPKCCTLELHG